VSGAYVDVKGGYYASATPFPLTLSDGLPVALGRGTNLAVQVSQQYRVIENPNSRKPWQVRTAAYHYTLRDHREEAEILSYQWHPNVPDSVTYPHLHLESAAGLSRSEFEQAHLPTGRVIIEDFVRLLIDDFGVPAARDDWEQALEKSRAEFDADRSW
jgi:hypothetical protein